MEQLSLFRYPLRPMSDERKVSLVYVLPRYNPDDSSHFFYLHELLAAAGRRRDIFLIIESAPSPPRDLPCRVYRQRCSSAPLRFVEIMAVMIRERLRGCRYFYTHYSFFGGVASGVVTRLFGGTAYYWNCGLPWRYPRGWLHEAAFRFTLCHTVLVTGTESLKEEYRRRYGLTAERIRVLPNWITASRFQKDRALARQELSIPPDAEVLLFVHWLSRRKGADLVPAIAREVTKQRQNAMFLIVGDGPERENLEFIIHNSELRSRVRIVGEVPNRKIPDYFAAADLFFMPSEEEGFPHVLLEAMAAGLPYVASDVGGVGEITPSSLQPFLVSAHEAGRFGEHMLALLALTPGERAKISAEERAWVGRYDLSAVLPQFQALFQ